jgi:hypothetical protein
VRKCLGVIKKCEICYSNNNIMGKNNRFEENIRIVSGGGDLREEWVFIYEHKGVKENKIPCICNRLIYRNINYMYNIKTNKIIVVGDGCYDRFSYDDKISNKIIIKVVKRIARKINGECEGFYERIKNVEEYTDRVESEMEEYIVMKYEKNKFRIRKLIELENEVRELIEKNQIERLREIYERIRERLRENKEIEVREGVRKEEEDRKRNEEKESIRREEEERKKREEERMIREAERKRKEDEERKRRELERLRKELYKECYRCYKGLEYYYHGMFMCVNCKNMIKICGCKSCPKREKNVRIKVARNVREEKAK